MALKGSLKEASVGDVCQLLALGSRTGCLSVMDRTRFGQIFLDRGRVSYARIVNRRDRLGDMLVRDGLLTRDQLRQVLDARERGNETRLGVLLLERRWIRRDDLERYVRRQVESAIFHILTWSRGSFSFHMGQRPDAPEMLFAIKIESLLLEAARQIDEWARIEKKIPSFDLVFEADQERLADSEAELTEEQRSIVPLMDGTRSVQELVDATGLREFDVGRAIFGLLQAGFAHDVASSANEQDKGSDQHEHRNLAVAFFRAGLLNDAARELRRLLEANPDDVRARLYLGLLALRENRPGDAIHELSILLQAQGPHYAAMVNVAVALRQLGHDQEALQALDQAERIRPDSAIVSLERGIIALRQERVTEAIAHFAGAKKRWGTDAVLPARYFYFAALASAVAGEKNAAALVRQGLAAHPESAPLLLLAGLLAERRRDLDTAERFYNQAIELDPAIVQTHKNLGDVLYRRGARERALSLYQRAAELAPDLGDDLYAKLGSLHYHARNHQGAIRCWKRALELNPRNEAVRSSLDIVAHANA